VETLNKQFSVMSPAIILQQLARLILGYSWIFSRDTIAATRHSPSSVAADVIIAWVRPLDKPFPP